MVAAIALLPVACDKENIPNTNDPTGTLYGTWVLDTKTVDTQTTSNGKTDSNQTVTDFTGDHFMLRLTDFFMAFGQEGSVLTFDIDDVDGTPYSYNSDLKQISFDKAIVLHKGFLNSKVMELYGKYDVLKLTKEKLILQKTDSMTLNDYTTKTVTVYSFHKVQTEGN